MLDQCFSTYIYSEVVAPERVTVLQDELLSTYVHLLNTGVFKKRWTQDTHSLSDVTFSKNAIASYGLFKLEEEIAIHVDRYLTQLKFPHKRDYKIESCWFTLNKHKEHSRMHSHGSCDLSGVYYIKTNGVDGDLYFHSPSPAIECSYLTGHTHMDLYAKPQVGKIFLFPACLLHGVTGNDTENERVSIAFNLTFLR